MKKLLTLLLTPILLFLFMNVALAVYIQPKKIVWTNSTSADVALHRVFVVSKETAEIDPINSPHADVAMPDSEYALPGTFDLGFLPPEGDDIKYGVAAIDQSGNISDVIGGTYFLDLQAPANPSAVAVINQ